MRTERAAFAAAGFGQNLVYNFVSLYLLLYLVEGVGLSSQGIATATAILFGVRIWDSIVDVLLGLMIDRTRTRWGRFRPWLMVIPAPLAVVTVVVFAVPDAAEPWQLVWFAVAYVLWSTIYTLADVPYWSLSNVITDDDAARTRIIAWARTAGIVGLALVTVLGPQLLRLGWFVAGLLIAVVGMGLYSLAFFGTRERDTPAETHGSLASTLRTVARMRALLWLLLSGVVGFGRMIFQVGGAVLAVVVFGSQDWFTLLGGALIVGMMVGALATPMVLRHTTRKRLMIHATWAAAVVLVITWLAGHRSVGVVAALIAAQGLLLGVHMVTQTAMVGDAVNDAELLTGSRHDGVAFAGLTFVTKLSGAFAAAAFGLAVSWVGYTQDAVVTDRMRNGLWATATLLPALSTVLSLLPLAAYRVPEQAMPALLARARAARGGTDASTLNGTGV